MTTAELFHVFAHEYDANGCFPVLDPQREQGAGLSEQQGFERHCQLNCVNDLAEIERLWRSHQEKCHAAGRPD